jgi:hypothetical protein
MKTALIVGGAAVGLFVLWRYVLGGSLGNLGAPGGTPAAPGLLGPPPTSTLAPSGQSAPFFGGFGATGVGVFGLLGSGGNVGSSSGIRPGGGALATVSVVQAPTPTVTTQLPVMRLDALRQLPQPGGTATVFAA